ncbi:TetR/AcrR family transcriptional regulator [Arthrobacter sp. HMWF013]|uniref:TetR/AcrR family transcriptional regulator n=1 Tax=Arthrobacter sp. HMWF013 TaxID=2056849 RepID=UPI000D3A1577|nr:TetR/AcrR family transcriptional regulator [Arthrobacter sp. HMWF013]PTT61403.1 TetR family transcriptional regulator [Arthrobacter sp. HMWF013]
MAEKKAQGAEGRARLNRERVLETAIRLADGGGIEKLSMRRLGDELGVEAMSLYNHVSNKEDLLNGMIDALYGEIELPSHGDDWKSAVRKRSVSVRAVLLRHPWANGLMDSATRPGPGTLRHHDRVLGTFRNGGFSLAMTAHAFSALDSYVYGFAKQEKALPFDTTEETADMANIMLAQLPASEYPYLYELTAKHVLRPGYSYADEFTFGLDLVLDALERARDSEG